MINIRGDTLIYTPKGLMRIDKLNIDDFIIDENGNNNKITNIITKKINNKNIYKLKIYNTIDNFYIYDNTLFDCLDNIPFELKYNEIINFLDENPFYQKINNIDIKKLNDFYYISYPIINFNNDINENNLNEDFFRFYGINLINNFFKKIIINNNNKNTIAFINKYLYNNNITYDIIDDENNTVFDIIDDLPLTDENIYNLNKDNTIKLLKGIIEFYYDKDDITNNFINIETSNKNIIYLLKYLLNKFEILPNILYINNNYIIKIPKIGIIKELFNITIDYNINLNYFIFNNRIWIRIKNIKNEKYTGIIYNIETELKSKITTEVGIIS